MSWRVLPRDDNNPQEEEAEEEEAKEPSDAPQQPHAGCGTSSGGDGETSVALQFDLPPGAYATVALREVSKERAPASRCGHIRF